MLFISYSAKRELITGRTDGWFTLQDNRLPKNAGEIEDIILSIKTARPALRDICPLNFVLL